MKINVPLFPNKNRTNPNAPTHTLSFKDENEQWQQVAALWKKTAQSGTEYLSLTLDTEVYEQYQKQRQNSYPKKTEAPAMPDNDAPVDVDDLPWGI